MSYYDSDEEYKYPDDDDKIWRHTSKWRPFQLHILKANFKDTNLENFINYKDVCLPSKAQNILLENVDFDKTININLNEDQKIFINRINQLSIFGDEPPVDLVASDILTACGFEGDKLHFRPKPNLKLRWNNHKITSQADYGVYSDRTLKFINKEYFLVVEDKPENKWNYQGGECQLYGEMLLAAINRYQDQKTSHIIYSMLIKGPLIRFYKAYFNKDYLKEIDIQQIPNIYIDVYRYPEEENTLLNINKHDNRKIILQTLYNIKIDIENMLN